MDYAGANANSLYKYQWDYIHNPQKMIGLLQDDEEGESGRVFINQLVKWIKENKEKPTPFHTAKFSDGEALVEVDLTYYPENGKSIIVHADLFPKYNSESAIDLSNEGKYTSVDPYKRVHTAFYLTFYYADHSEEMKEAIKIWTYSYEDFQVLLSDLGYTITETDKKDIIESYKFALNESEYDCNKLDVIFEMMPGFVIDQLSDNALWESLYSLLNNCNASRWGTDEYKAIANILNNISESFLHEKIEQNKLLFKEMLSDVPEAFIGDYVYALCKVGASVWSDSELSSAGYTLLYPSESVDVTEYSYFNLEGDPTYQIGAIKEHEDEKEVGYTLGRMYVTIDKVNKLMVNYKIVGMEDYSLFDPVKVHIDNQESMHMPAFVVYEIIDRNPYDPFKDLVNTAAAVLLPEIKFVRLKSLSRLFKGRTINASEITSTGDVITQLTNKLISRGISSSTADDIAIRVMYIDEAIGANKMTSLLDELVSSPKFKNPEDLVDNLNSVFSGDNVNSVSARNLYKEFQEGKYWIGQGNEVYISKKWTANADEVDVAITTKSTLVECKNITSNNYKAVEDNLKAIVDKYTIENKLSTNIKNQYPNHYGKMSISSTNNPFYNSTKADFISKIKSGDVGNGQMSIIGNGTNQIPLTDLRKVAELHIENGLGRFIIKNTDW
jgi:hypothetical protein